MISPIDQIKDRLDIVDLIGSYIKLDKAGRNFKARCPFHNEKTPSFIVSPDRQSFYCFGCQAKGDIFEFVQKFEGLEFKEALKVLADRAGVELKALRKEDIEEVNKKERQLKSLDEAARIYEQQLSGALEVRKYLDKRGVTEDAIKKWRIGWAPNDWRIIYEKLKERGFTEKELLEVGLIKQPLEKDKRPYDVFRGRVMFPIFDISGRVIAFSGRIFEDDNKSPKYVNTPETEIFKKSDVLYGLHEAKTVIRRLDYTVLVEGQFDLVMSHQVGVRNTVATSGTALTESHLKRLQKLSNRLIIANDSDQAGRAAVRRGGELALSLGMEVKIAPLPEAEDPASIILKSAEEWKEILKSSVDLVEFVIDGAVSQTIRAGKKQTELLKEFNKSVIPLLSAIESEIIRSHYVALASKKTAIAERSIWVDLEKFSAGSKNYAPYGAAAAPSSFEPIVLTPEEMLRGILLFTEKSYKFDEIKERLEKLIGKEAYSEMIDNSRFDDHTLIFETEARFAHSDPMKAAEELLKRIEKGVIEKKLQETALSLDKTKDAEERERLKREAGILSKRISEI